MYLLYTFCAGDKLAMIANFYVWNLQQERPELSVGWKPLRKGGRGEMVWLGNLWVEMTP